KETSYEDPLWGTREIGMPMLVRCGYEPFAPQQQRGYHPRCHLQRPNELRHHSDLRGGQQPNKWPHNNPLEPRETGARELIGSLLRPPHIQLPLPHLGRSGHECRGYTAPSLRHESTRRWEMGQSQSVCRLGWGCASLRRQPYYPRLEPLARESVAPAPGAVQLPSPREQDQARVYAVVARR